MALCAIVAGCTPRRETVPPRDDRVAIERDPANPSNVLVTITFLNPEQTLEEGVVVNYHSVFLERPDDAAGTNVLLGLSPGPEADVSTCRFSIPQTEVGRCRVSLSGVENKPIGEAVVGRVIDLGASTAAQR